MKNMARLQYWLAALIGLIFLSAQVVSLLADIGHGFSNEKNTLMFWQGWEEISRRPWSIVEIVGYIGFALIAHVALPLSALYSYRAVFSHRFPRGSRRYGLLFVLLTVLVACMWNRLLYPTSRAIESVELLMVQDASLAFLWGSSFIVVSVFLAALAKLAMQHIGVTAVAASLIGVVSLMPFRPEVTENTAQPDVIILGVDSLRKDFVYAHGFPSRELTPTINELMDEMVVVDGATTPLARTFVSYMSLLAGSNPPVHGVRFNLFPWDDIKETKFISRQLAEHGYQTILAMDESRFANFPPMLGFEKVIIPKQGVMDFALGSYYDLVVTNLILEAPYVGPLVSYVFGNRAAYRTYSPRHHVQKVLRTLRSSDRSRPMFLISHFCLPHWPYLAGSLWFKDDFEYYNRLPGYEDVPVSYFRALAAADGQLSAVLSGLKEAGRLDNALVFLISDHGESFNLRRDEIHDMDRGIPMGSFGHGGFVLSVEQNSIVMGFQYYKNGIGQMAPRTVKMDSSIIDIAPTIDDVLFGSIAGYEGKSLLQGLISSSPDGEAEPRLLFVESGIRSAGVERAVIDEKEVAEEMAYLYRVTSDLRFEVKPDFIVPQLALKQRAAVYGGMVVAAMPRAFEGGFGDCWAVLNVGRKEVRCDSYPSSDELVRKMQDALCGYHSADTAFSEVWCREGAPAIWHERVR